MATLAWCCKIEFSFYICTISLLVAFALTPCVSHAERFHYFFTSQAASLGVPGITAKQETLLAISYTAVAS